MNGWVFTQHNTWLSVSCANVEKGLKMKVFILFYVFEKSSRSDMLKVAMVGYILR